MACLDYPKNMKDRILKKLKVQIAYAVATFFDAKKAY